LTRFLLTTLYDLGVPLGMAILDVTAASRRRPFRLKIG
jgi:hypothetical protein